MLPVKDGSPRLTRYVLLIQFLEVWRLSMYLFILHWGKDYLLCITKFQLLYLETIYREPLLCSFSDWVILW